MSLTDKELKVTLYSAPDLMVMFYRLVIPARGVKKPEWTGLCEGLCPPHPMIFFCTDTTDTWKRVFASAACFAFAGGLTIAALNSFQWSEQALYSPGTFTKVGARSSSLHTEGDLLCQHQKCPGDPRCCPVKLHDWQQGLLQPPDWSSGETQHDRLGFLGVQLH